MRCVVLGMRNAVRCEIWCYGDMVIWPALQARAFALVIFNCAMVRSSSSSSSSFVIPKKFSQSCTLPLACARVVVVVRHTQKIHPIVHAATGARACPSNGICRICDFDFWHDKSI